METIHDIIPQNVNIKPRLAIQEKLNKHTETINNIAKLEEEAQKFKLAAKKIQTAQAKLELDYSKETLRSLFCKKNQYIGTSLIEYIQVHYNNHDLDELPLRMAAGAALYNSLAHITFETDAIFKYLHSTKQIILKQIIESTLK